MKKKLCACLLATVMFSLCFTTGAGAAVILGFDDIGSGSSVVVPDGYGGLNWGTVGEIPLTANASNGAFLDGVVSPAYAAIFGTSTHTVTNPGGTFDFVGAYFTGGWYTKTAPVKGYLGGNEIYTTSVSAVNYNQTWYQFDWTGIDTLVFPVIEDGGQPGYNDDYVVDNFTIDNVSTVPEPSTLVLFGLGIVGLASRAGRRRRRDGGQKRSC